ncbi:putative stearoyl-CoA desaturase [Apostichopus japonicus]|uniref:Putative stearoyl-CoA desaturase n=1 Tax=Stichopus japonicus TaxID=307972 RepID=A0A2G8KEW2_STIJA|nr:putative stearoyl-CoA desaturase [Apostichopus japonicus]PIK46505.1 putative stearoyl-CoA desaturase [Apostichopus japonicus]
MVEAHPEVPEKKDQLDSSDLLADPVVHYQHNVPMGRVGVVRILNRRDHPVGLDVQHHLLRQQRRSLLGHHPYDDRIDPAQNFLVSFFALGEGWHNYHHVFPFDYRTSEFPWKINPTTQFIDLMNFFGLAYDLKSVPKEVIKARAQKTGDGRYTYAKRGQRSMTSSSREH